VQTIVEREALLLAPYAMHSADSRGRRYPEPAHPYRGPFQRDRDRILHSAAYRRLSGKMQVFTGDMGDYHRTRLTHTQEVASIARTLGRALRLNEDLIEALALVHDIGHPPFGHAGEDALDECLADEGGFSHNRQALVIVEELELRYPNFPGLNLTWETLEGQQTRASKGAATYPQSATSPTEPPSEPSTETAAGRLLEVKVVEAADSITYDAHDTDDAIELGLVEIGELEQVSLARECLKRVRNRFGALDAEVLRRAVVHELIDRQVSDVLTRTVTVLAELSPPTAEAARRADVPISGSAELVSQKAELEDFLKKRVYRHPRLIEVRHKAQQRLRAMFELYAQRTELLPEKFQARAAKVGPRRAAADYLAGMTDRYCDEQYHRHLGGKCAD
jgi:dGTPase